jgi:hypothetical protein
VKPLRSGGPQLRLAREAVANALKGI